MSEDVFRTTYKPLTSEASLNILSVKAKAKELYDSFDSCGPSREVSLAKTKLEEAVFWATKHLTR